MALACHPTACLMDILQILGPTAPHLRRLWARIRPLSTECHDWAEDAFDAHMYHRAAQLELALDVCFRSLNTFSPLFDCVDEQHRRDAVRAMAILGGTAELIFQAIVDRAPLKNSPAALARCGIPATYEELLRVSYPAFDRNVLTDMPHRGRLGYSHVAELLTRLGELRVFTATDGGAPFSELDDDHQETTDLAPHGAIGPDHEPVLILWGRPEEQVHAACMAYLRLQRCRWAWPARGFPHLQAAMAGPDMDPLD